MPLEIQLLVGPVHDQGEESPSSHPGQANGDPVSEPVYFYKVYDFLRPAHSFLKQSSDFYTFFFMLSSNCLPYIFHDWFSFCPVEQPQTPLFYVTVTLIFESKYPF